MSKEEKAGVDHMFEMMMASKQQLLLKKAMFNEWEQFGCVSDKQIYEIKKLVAETRPKDYQRLSFDEENKNHSCPLSYSFCIFFGSLSGNMAFIASSLPSFIAVS